MRMHFRHIWNSLLRSERNIQRRESTLLKRIEEIEEKIGHMKSDKDSVQLRRIKRELHDMKRGLHVPSHQRAPVV
ncbi:hypothetical protein JXB11_03190 [Candidatus Woesearchaeota archaeon]|nr:hypothetical protein [Candidatus Woesearchaeota archaeon]